MREREFKGLIFVIWRRGDVSQTINTFSYASFVCKCTMTQYPRPPRTIIRNKLSIAQHTACGKQFGTRICTLGVWGKTHCTPETLPPSLPVDFDWNVYEIDAIGSQLYFLSELIDYRRIRRTRFYARSIGEKYACNLSTFFMNFSERQLKFTMRWDSKWKGRWLEGKKLQAESCECKFALFKVF